MSNTEELKKIILMLQNEIKIAYYSGYINCAKADPLQFRKHGSEMCDESWEKHKTDREI